MEQEIGTWDSVLLENLSEDSFINNIHLRYQRDYIYTYIGTSVVAVNPYHHISEDSLELISSYGTKGIFQLPPHIYGLTNLAFQSLKDQSEDQCIILTGESGSGKTESFKMIVNFLTHIQQPSRSSRQQLCKQSSNSSSCSQTRYTKSPQSNTHRRTASGCGGAKQRHSPCSVSTTNFTKLRAESSDRQAMRRNMREKMVDFDFTRHKSSENISNLNDCDGRVSGRTSACGFYETKSCFKLPQTHTPFRGNMSRHSAVGGCRLCGHCRCTRGTSLEKDELKSSNSHYRNSCSNLMMKQQSHESQDSASCLLGGSMHRISLYDAHKLSQQQTDSNGAFPQLSSKSLRTQRSFQQKLRECVTCADVFLEAMGNAVTLKNNNSSRYGKLFDIEINFKGDPIGVHITHYTSNKYLHWREKFSHILSIIIRS